MNRRRIRQVALSLMVGAGLTCCYGLLPVSAQDQDQPMENQEAYGPMFVDPAPLGYPFAPPGGLQMSHWADYTGSQINSGSATDARMHARRTAEERAMKSDALNEDKMTADVAPLDYPWAAPASLHMSYWTDYTRNELAPGSAAGERWRQRHQTEEQEMQRDHGAWQGWSDFDVAPLTYPWAAPASLHMSHWTDYTRTELAPGSAADERAEKRRQMRMQEQPQAQPMPK